MNTPDEKLAFMKVHRSFLEFLFCIFAYLVGLCFFVCSTMGIISLEQRLSSLFEVFFLFLFGLELLFTVYLCRLLVWIFAKVFSFKWIVPLRMVVALLLWFACALAFPYIQCYFSVSDYLSKFDLKAVSFTPVRWRGKARCFDDADESTVLVKTLLLNKALASSSYLGQHPLQESQGVRTAQFDLSETESLQMTIKPDKAGDSTVVFRYFDSSQSFR